MPHLAYGHDAVEFDAEEKKLLLCLNYSAN
jgi:hypothetical protein